MEKTYGDGSVIKSSWDGTYKDGFTKREMFALKAMQAVESANIPNGYHTEILTAKEVAERAVRMADALIEALNKEK